MSAPAADPFLAAPERVPRPPPALAPWSAAAAAAWRPERPQDAARYGAAAWWRGPATTRRSRAQALLRVLTGPMAVAFVVAVRAVTALTVPVAWVAVVATGRLPARLVSLYRWRIDAVGRGRAYAWVTADAGAAGAGRLGVPVHAGVAAPASGLPPYPRGRALAWPLRAAFLLGERYFAFWLALAVVPAAAGCALAAGRVPAGLARLQRTALAWLSAGDAFLLLLVAERPRLPEPAVHRRGALADGPATRLSPWPAVAALWAVLASIGASFLAALPVIAVSSVVPAAGDELELVAGALQSLSFVVVAVGLGRLYGPVRPAHFGLAELAFWRSLGWAAITVVLFLVLFAALVFAMAPLLSVADLAQSDDAPALVAAVVAVAVLPPVCEEVFFRGFVFATLRRWKGAWVGAVLSALLFSAAHLDFEAVLFADRLVAGVAFALVYAKTGRLLPSIMAHAANNAVVLGVQRGWDWEVPLLVAACVLACTLIVRPFCGRGARAPEAARG